MTLSPALQDLRAFLLAVRARAREGPLALYATSALTWAEVHGWSARLGYRLAFVAWLVDTGRLHDGGRDEEEIGL